MKVLVACEEPQRVCTAFRDRGHEAYSCDIIEPSGGHPEWHIRGDVRRVLNPRNHGSSKSIAFITMDGEFHEIKSWDIIIAHPPCTYLSSVGASRLFDANHRIKDEQRELNGRKAVDFFKNILYSSAEHICVENPAPLKYWGLPPYDQIIEPYMFGDPWKKRTCLWLKGLPALKPTNIVEPKGCWTIMHGGVTCRVKRICEGGAKSAKERSRTFPGIARAMAEQWG